MRRGDTSRKGQRSLAAISIVNTTNTSLFSYVTNKSRKTLSIINAWYALSCLSVTSRSSRDGCAMGVSQTLYAFIFSDCASRRTTKSSTITVELTSNTETSESITRSIRSSAITVSDAIDASMLRDNTSLSVTLGILHTLDTSVGCSVTSFQGASTVFIKDTLNAAA